ncbi:hypothetical protein SH661x_001849 [Planctomicrobium sp. SH661]|uniref:hypothetical protein n=1 Tax=Planctomicrobium sp. SH661 TaxID=3448124 RepID=UPI003F5B6220
MSQVAFACSCGKQVKGKPGDIVTCPYCFENVGVPDVQAQKQIEKEAARLKNLQEIREAQMAAYEAMPPGPPIVPPSLAPRFRRLWIVANAAQILTAISSVLLVASSLVASVDEGAAKGLSAYLFTSAAACLPTFVAFGVAKAIAEIANSAAKD